MKRPEKENSFRSHPGKNYQLWDDKDNIYEYGKIIGYNKGCDDWEKFLPDEQEIASIIEEASYDFDEEAALRETVKNLTPYEFIARELLKRIGKELK